MIDIDGYRPNVGIVILNAQGQLFWARRVNRDGWQFPQGGMRTDEKARVLDDHGAPIGGLYAIGNNAASAMGRSYPGAGVTLGPAMTFGYIAARDITGANE